jgi:phosphatidylglycerol:prolipoprotein diacylglycerol transferase
MGCFMVHDHPGKITDFFLAVNDYQYHGLAVGPRHDLGLYEVFWSAAMIPLFFWLDRKPRPHGFFIGTIAVLYSPFRFALDFLREADATYFGLTPAHYACVLSFVVGAWLLWRCYHHPIENIPPALLQAAPAQKPKSRRPKPART